MIVAVLLTVTSAAFASGDGKKSKRAAVIPGSNSTFKLLYAPKEQNVVKIKIKDEHGKLVKIEKIKNDGGFLRRYHMDLMEPGTYSFEITDNNGSYTQEVVLK
ncbi:putative secreted protein (Por secretion system target) [Marinoscillum furvescens DSM 4134]|uniref:Putative secreted protein (Por secretion system target) n=2 Tax=Marinoscillum furvescens TaxID=1026 RepID=A0A3D9LGN1_MARFU|nr:putative secreted protein (Por secretion system target) [Marinoscillum furvescens DSM 4134]